MQITTNHNFFCICYCHFLAGKYHEQIRIAEGSVGHSYGALFGRFIDENLTSVEVEDPYIRSVHQVIIIK